jgi:hypothetical protein
MSPMLEITRAKGKSDKEAYSTAMKFLCFSVQLVKGSWRNTRAPRK